MDKLDEKIDISNEICPMTFVRAKLRLEELAVGQILSITLRDGEASYNVPRAMQDHGHEIISQKEIGNNLVVIRVKKRL